MINRAQDLAGLLDLAWSLRLGPKWAKDPRVPELHDYAAAEEACEKAARLPNPTPNIIDPDESSPGDADADVDMDADTVFARLKTPKPLEPPKPLTSIDFGLAGSLTDPTPKGS